MTDRTVPQYDFYATPQAVAPPVPTQPTSVPTSVPAVPSAPVFGAPAVNQFGTPLGVPGATLSAAHAPAPPVRARGAQVPRWVWRIVLPLAVMLVLGLFGVGRLGFLDLFQQDLEAPATLAGMPAVPQDSPVGQALAPLVATINASEEEVVVQVYSDQTARAAVLVAGPDDGTDVAQVLAADGLTVTTTGSSTCGVDAARATTVCVRTGDGRAVAVFHSGTDAAATALVTDEAFAAVG